MVIYAQYYTLVFHKKILLHVKVKTGSIFILYYTNTVSPIYILENMLCNITLHETTCPIVI